MADLIQDTPIDTRLQREALELAITEMEVLRDCAMEAAEEARKQDKVLIDLSETSKATGHTDALAVLHRINTDLLRAEVAGKKAVIEAMEAENK